MRKIENMELFVIQKGKCFYCGRPMSLTRGEVVVGWTADHFFPKSAGNSLNGNIVLCHGICNVDKGEREPTAAEIIRKEELYKKAERRKLTLQEMRGNAHTHTV